MRRAVAIGAAAVAVVGALVGAALAAGGAAGNGGPVVEPWMAIIMSAGGLLGGGGALWKAVGLAQQIGQWQGEVGQALKDIARRLASVEEHAVMDAPYATEAGARKAELRDIKERVGRVEDQVVSIRVTLGRGSAP